MFGDKRVDCACCRDGFRCRHELLVCISLFGLLLLFCDVSASDGRVDGRYACQLGCLRPFGCQRSKLCRPLMCRGRPLDGREGTRSGRGD